MLAGQSIDQWHAARVPGCSASLSSELSKAVCNQCWKLQEFHICGVPAVALSLSRVKHDAAFAITICCKTGTRQKPQSFCEDKLTSHILHIMQTKCPLAFVHD